MIKIYMGVIVPLSILLPIFFAILKWRYLTAEAKIILWYLLVSAVINFVATIIGKFFHMNNLPLVHILTVLEIIILSAFYKKLLSKKAKPIFYVLLPLVFALLCIANAIFLQSIFTYCSYTRSIAAIIIMIFAINYFAKIAAEFEGEKVYKDPAFYFNSGIFLYYSGAFMLFIFSNFTIAANESMSNFYVIWGMHASLILIMHIILSIGFILCKK